MDKPKFFATFVIAFLLLFIQEEYSMASELDSGFGKIKGNITDKEKPYNNIPGASVTCERLALGSEVMTTITDSKGNYEIIGLWPGIHAVTVTKEGYNEAFERIEIADGQEVICNFKLHVVGTRYKYFQHLKILMLGVMVGIISLVYLYYAG